MGNVVPMPASASGFTAPQLALIRRTVAADTTPDEFDLFIAAARHAGLDPFRKQISAIVFNKAKADKRKMSIIVNIDGFRVIAARTGGYRPDDRDPVFTFDEALKSPENPKGLVSASVRVFKRDQDGSWFPCAGTAYWDEFAPIKDEWSNGGKTGRKTVDGNWSKMPLVMLAKCAEAQALRRAFPDALSGLYSEDEMARTVTAEVTASEAIEQYEQTQRLERIGGPSITMAMEPNAPLERVPVGQAADRIAAALRDMVDVRQVDAFAATNREGLRELWAHSASDGLEIKRMIEARRADLGGA